MTSPLPPAPRPIVHLYVIVDKRDPDPRTPTPIGVGLSRQKCRELISFDPDSDHYRIRRAKATIYES
jgi:hypothetical protein